jgi:hypothetical protein
MGNTEMKKIIRGYSCRKEVNIKIDLKKITTRGYEVG